MKLVCEGPGRSGCGFVVLAPPQDHSVPFHEIVDDTSRHRRLLADAQRLRGEIYVRDGAIQAWELSADRRHIQPSDALSWHLLKVDERDSVTACIRYRAHRPGASFSDLAVSTATTRHHSSAILRRIGGRPLMARGREVPAYFDPHYNCEMELLRFDSTSPAEQYAGLMRECRDALLELPVVSQESSLQILLPQLGEPSRFRVTRMNDHAVAESQIAAGLEAYTAVL